MPTNRLLITWLLGEEGKIGLFFFQEFLRVFLSTMSLFMLVPCALFFPIPSMLLVILPGTFLLLVGLIRFFASAAEKATWLTFLALWLSRQGVCPIETGALL